MYLHGNASSEKGILLKQQAWLHIVKISFQVWKLFNSFQNYLKIVIRILPCEVQELLSLWTTWNFNSFHHNRNPYKIHIIKIIIYQILEQTIHYLPNGR